jgi:hypothetical protein
MQPRFREPAESRFTRRGLEKESPAKTVSAGDSGVLKGENFY